MTGSEYKYGFVTDVEEDRVPNGLSEDVVRQISAKKDEPEWMTEWRLEAYRRWLTMDRADLAEAALPADRLPGDQLLLGAQGRRSGRSRWTRSTRRSVETYDKLGIPLREQEILAGVAVDSVFDSVSVGDHLPKEAGRARASSSARSPRRSASIPSWCASISARSCRRATTSSPR